MIILFLIGIIYAMGKIIRRKVNELTQANQYILETRRRQSMLNVAVSLSHELNTDIGNALTLNSLADRKTNSIETLIHGPQLKKSQHFEKDDDMLFSLCSHMNHAIVPYKDTLDSKK